MKGAFGTLIPIKLVLEKMIPLLESKDLASLLRQKLMASVVEYLSVQGIEGAPAVEVQVSGENERVMQVFVHGVRQPYSPETIRRAWQSRVPGRLRDLPDRETISHRFPDRWLNEYLLGLDHADQEAIDRSITFLSDLAFAAILENPSCLISEPQVLQYVGNLDESLQVDVDFTANVLAFLLDHGVSVVDARSILDAIRQGYRLGRSSEDTSELLFARLKSPQLELIVSPAEFRALTGCEEVHSVISVYSNEVSKESQGLMNTMEEGLFRETGLYLPDLVWKIDPDMPSGLIAFRTNYQTTQCIPLLAHDELLVNDTPDHLKLLNVTTAATTTNPADGKPCSVVSVAHKAALESAGLTTWEPLGYLALLTAGEIKRRAPQLFTVDDAAYHLAQIRLYFPALIEKNLNRFSIEDLARVLRALLAERISIRDLPSILERLIQYDTITVDASRFTVFDERLPIAPSSKVLHPESWRSYYEFLRSGMKRQITSVLLQGRNTIPVYLLDAKLEQWLITENMLAQADLQELADKRHAIRQAIWAQISPSAGRNPIILTTTEPRVSLREIIVREMPDVQIMAYSELTPDVKHVPVSRISLPEDFGEASLV
jgi:hypothetical protein